MGEGEGDEPVDENYFYLGNTVESSGAVQEQRTSNGEETRGSTRHGGQRVNN